MSEPAPRPSRLISLDLIKAMAMIGVLAQHSLHALRPYGGGFWVLQSVPLLMVMFGFNGGGSLVRSPGITWAWYWHTYLRRRFTRLLVPISIAWLVSLLLGAALGRLEVGATLFAGAFPLPGPGNYFVPVVVVMTLALPALWVLLSRWPGRTLGAALAINVIFEVIAPHVDGLWGQTNFLFDGNALRYAGVTVAGLWLAKHGVSRASLLPFLLLLPLSIAYLIMDWVHPPALDFVMPGFVRTTNVGAVAYVVVLFVVLLRLLPRTSTTRALRALGVVGQASFHIFLFQMLYFAAVQPSRGWATFVLATCVSFVAGTMWMLIENKGLSRLAAFRSNWRPTGLRIEGTATHG